LEISSFLAYMGIVPPRAELTTAERDENTCREDMKVTEMVALGLILEPLERLKAKDRQEELGRTHGTPSEKFTEGAKGNTRDIVGEAIQFTAS